MTTDESYDLLNTILEENYYIPDISELCIGFEYSYKTDVIEHRIIESKYGLEFAFGLHLDNNLFVKKLDVKDIKSFGFKDVTLPQSIGKHFVKDGVRVAFEGGIKTYIADGINIVFRGVVKNKSELKRLFRQLNIC